MSQAEFPYCSVDDAEQAISLIAERLISPESCADISLRPGNQDEQWNSVMWEPVGLGHGHPGVALLYSELARNDERWNHAAAAHVAAAMRAQPGLPSNGLYYGPASTYAAVRCSVSRSDVLSPLHRPLATWVAEDAATRARAWLKHLSSEDPGVNWSSYDIINGLSGQARVLLTDYGRGWDEVDRAVDLIVDALVTITAPTAVERRTVPGWWVPNASQPVPQDRDRYPQGDFNLGMAHGIAGVVAVFASLLDHGLEDSRVQESLEYSATWLLSRVGKDATGPYWPARISWEDELTGTIPGPESTRAAWCYGTPGVAAALLSAQPHLEFPVADLAIDALHALHIRGRDSWGLDGATVCHGYAGLLQILVRSATHTSDPMLRRQADVVASYLLEETDPAAPFAVRHSIPTGSRDQHGLRDLRGLDVVGSLEGAAGVACALHDWVRLASGDLTTIPSPSDTSWDLTLALS